ncbi:MAG TPA: hypothetical protein VKD70_17700 [Candidatus Acidoferrum sp.]|nr:hypothetical protein [Candidatus Acidoferrum sp.]
MVSIDQYQEPGRFVNPQIVHTKTFDGKELVVVSGIVLVHLKGTSQADWLRDTLRLGIDIARICPPNQGLLTEQSAPLVTLNAVYNQNVSNNAGYAVDSCQLLNQPQAWRTIWVDSAVAVRDTDGWLYRVGYNITLIGTFKDLQQIP